LLLPATQISLATIIESLDGPLALLPCLTSDRSRRCAGCPERETCPLRLVLGEAHEATLRVLETTTLADIVRRSADREPGLLAV
jgi:DNA-binding IscR family transcriptional regulator